MPDAAPTQPGGLLYLLFAAGGEAYAVEALDTLKVIEPGRISILPRLPPEVVGVTHHRGRIITIVYLPALAQEGAEPVLGPNSRIVILDLGHRNIGLLADSVIRIDALDLEGLRRAPDSHARPFGLRGLVDVLGAPVAVLESGPLIEALEAIGERLPSLGPPGPNR